MSKYTGIEKVCEETKSLEGYFSGKYLQLNVDISTGEVWADYFDNYGHNDWNEYHDKDIINCGNISNPMTEKEIEEMINAAIKEHEFFAQFE